MKLTVEEHERILAKMQSMVLCAGNGYGETACTVEAINLALTGKHTDEIPDCMSEVIGRWIVRTQDAMPSEIRNSERWKLAASNAAGTGRDAAKEQQRLAMIMEWMWCVLTELQPIADKNGFGDEWRTMTIEKTKAAAFAADETALAATAAGAVAGSAGSAEFAALAADAANAASAAWWAANAAAIAAYAAADAGFWIKADPCGLLELLTNV